MQKEKKRNKIEIKKRTHNKQTENFHHSYCTFRKTLEEEEEEAAVSPGDAGGGDIKVEFVFHLDTPFSTHTHKRRHTFSHVNEIIALTAH